jgi:hypothetical protein
MKCPASTIAGVPGAIYLSRPSGFLQADIEYLRAIGARNIRVNQQQVTVRNDVEYDTPTSGRGPSHQSRITSNDTNAETILLIVP